MEEMDEGVGDEIAPVHAAEGAHLQNKEIEYSLRPESCNMMESREMAITEVTAPNGSFQILADMLEGKSGNRIVIPVHAVENPCPHNANDAGIMVEELTVQKPNRSNLSIVGTSNHRERIPTGLDGRQHLYQLATGSGSGTSLGDRSHGSTMLGAWEDVANTSVHEFLAHKPLNNELNANLDPSVSGNMLSYGSIRTKILSKSGFSEFFVKTSLKGKGIVCRGPQHTAFKRQKDLNDTKAVVATTMPSDASLKDAGDMMVTSNVSLKPAGVLTVAPNASLKLGARIDVPSSGRIGGPRLGNSDHGVNMREWLDARVHKGKQIDCLYIFRQIVDMVDNYHNQGVTLLDLRPSSFKLSHSKQVKYVGPISQKVSLESATDQDIPRSEKHWLCRRSAEEEEMFATGVTSAKKQKVNNNMNFSSRWPLFHSRFGIKDERGNEIDINEASTYNDANGHHTSVGYGTHSKTSSLLASNIAQQQSTSASGQLEEKWYASPEELSEGVCTILSNIYSLGVLFFELLGHFDSKRAHAAAMSDLRHRILPPSFLSENPKEAGFCLWLLHPEPLSRPTTREILQSEVTNGFQGVCAEELLSSIQHDDSESELLLHFLISLEEQKKNQASKLVGDIQCLEADIAEVERRHCLKVDSCLQSKTIHARESRYFNKQPASSETQFSPISGGVDEMRLMRNFSQLERAYFSMRSQIQLAYSDSTIRTDYDLLKDRENRFLAQQDQDIQNPFDRIGAFFDGLCKYARYSKFEVHGMLRTGEFNNSANVICSLSFDRDEDHFAAAGVSKKLKIFEFKALFNDSVDVHYPAVEMSNRSKLSCVCWNNYIRNYLASSDYDGVVKLWDASTGQTVSHYIEHEKRAWSVDFSQLHPTKLASGSDDCSVKLWNINEKNSLGTIRNMANVCCVQFSAHSTHLLAFGSADYRTYCYDLRNARAPWCVLAGHEKAVSYVKFLDSGTLVTASTDNTLKLWDLKKTSHTGPSTNACSLTLSGHTNEKNFVGLSTANGYIACGSESNEVYAYHRSLPMPITSYKFGSIDPISGKETDDDNGLFVSSVCWRQRSDMVVAANSSGCIKLLRLV